MRTRREPPNAAPEADTTPPTQAAEPATGKAPEQAPAPPRKRVRSRLLTLVLVCLLAVLVVGAPGIVAAVTDLSESQRLEGLGRLNSRAVALSHSLADERDEMALFVAGGRSTASGAGVTEDQRGRVDRQAEDVTEYSSDVDADDGPAAAEQTAEIRELLGTLPELRQTALSGPGSAKATFDGYTELIEALNGLAGTIAGELPGRAADEDTRALPALTRAVHQATAQRGLLLTALVSGGAQPGTVTAAQQAVVGEESALADFGVTASDEAADRYAETVTGKDVDDAEALVARLTDTGGLTGADLRVEPEDLQTLLTARIDRMRSVESSLAADTAAHLRDIRDADVVALEIRVGLTGLAALLVLGLTVTVSRSVVRPLAGLHRAARDLRGKVLPALARTDHEVPQPKPVNPVGRDEFRDVAAAVNELQELAVRIHWERTSAAQAHTEVTGLRDALAAERDALLHRQRELLEERDTLQVNLHNTFVNLSMRTLSLVERQLTLIERLEDHEQDPTQLESLFRLDHLATRMRRNGENLLVLAGVDTGSSYRKAVPLLDVMRAAISEIERYERVQIQFLPRVLVAGRSADDISHLVAELLENATAFSPPQAEVEVSGWVLENGGVMLSVEDCGIGVPADRLAKLNERLADPDPAEDPVSRGMGLFVVGRLAHRYGIRVQLREMRGGGVTAVVVLPRRLVVPDDRVDVSSTELKAKDEPRPAPRASVPGQRSRSALPRSAPPSPSSSAAHEPVPLPHLDAHLDDVYLDDVHAAPDAAPDPEPAPRGTSRRLDQLLRGTPPAASDAPATPDAVSPTPLAGDEQHARPNADTPAQPVRPKQDPPGDEPPAQDAPDAQADVETDKAAADVPAVTPVGLPKRVPMANALPGAPPGPNSHLRRDAGAGTGRRPGTGGGQGGATGTGSVDAAELRRKLGGFQQGLRDGRREADALLPPPPRPRAAQPSAHPPSAPSDPEDGEARA